MFADNTHDRTIAPTARRLAEARRAGATAHSRELTSAVALIAAAVVLYFVGPQLWTAVRELIHAAWGAPSLSIEGSIAPATEEVLLRIGGLVACMLVAPLLSAALANSLQSGFRFNVHWPRPHLSAVNPIAGLRRVMGRLGWFAIAGLAMKLAIAAWIVHRILGDWSAFSTVRRGNAAAFSVEVGGRIAAVAVQISAVFVVLSLLDWAYRRRKWLRSLRLTSMEARQEARDAKAVRRPRTRSSVSVSGSLAALSRPELRDAQAVDAGEGVDGEVAHARD